MSEPKTVRIRTERGSPMSTSMCAEESFELLNEGAKSVWRGQGDTWTAARDRAADQAGLTPAQAERLQKNWKTMKFPNGDVYRLLRNSYGHLCSFVETKAEAMERQAQQIGARQNNETLQGARTVGAGMEGTSQGGEK